LYLFNKTSAVLKQCLFLLLLLLLIGQASNVQAQNNVSTIESLAVDIWPDYDRPSVLILLTGFLPANTPLPATITVPVPEDIDLNAVARITDEGDLFADITFDESVNGQVTLTTPDPRFRIEYYMPYNLDGNERTFTFDWQADVDVTELLVSVQQPVAAEDLTTDPAEFSVTTRQDGFQYHNLSPIEVPAGDSFSIQVSYSRAVTQLSAELLQPAVDIDTTTNSQPETPTGTQLNLTTILLASGGVAVLAVGAWMIFGERLVAARRAPARSRSASVPTRPKAPQPEREQRQETADSPSPTFVQFCHRCGQKSDPDDRFCRSCGTRLKTKP
jgi:hypothetical protein